MWELMGCLELENQVIKGMMSQLHLVRNYNNMLIKRWDPGHVDVGNGWVVEQLGSRSRIVVYYFIFCL